jgi:hypothetical protein
VILTVLKKDFAEAYKIANQSTAFKNRYVDNPFKKSFVIDGSINSGDQIPIRSLVKKFKLMVINGVLDIKLLIFFTVLKELKENLLLI